MTDNPSREPNIAENNGVHKTRPPSTLIEPFIPGIHDPHHRESSSGAVFRWVGSISLQVVLNGPRGWVASP
eukprot:767350-Hanusia_phi.AAC.1